MINYFEVLNISENAEIEIIRSSYKTLAKKYHPDSTGLPPEIAKQRMSEINEAYRVLSNEDMKKEYLQRLHSQEDVKIPIHTESRERSYEYEERSSDSKIYYVIGFIVLVCVMCCICYFVPELLTETWNNILGSFEEVFNTF